MRMKYFRFLYGETGQCFLHFGELQDTTKEEAYTFLYLRKMGKHVNQTNSGHRLFLLPKHLNLVVLGNADEECFHVLSELLQEAAVDTLILNANTQFASQGKPEGVGEMITLGTDIYQVRREGWYFLVRSFADGSVAMAHGLPTESREELFEDCVMCVKDLREGSLCRRKSSPDKYGCALGCALHQDYDVCKYRGNERKPEFLSGTLLLGGEDETACRELLREAQENIGAIRFICLAGGSDLEGGGQFAPDAGYRSGQEALSADGRNHSGAAYASADRHDSEFPGENRGQRTEGSDLRSDGFRRYLIGTEELDDHAVAKLSRGGWNQRPVILSEGEGICCSGFLKYTS